MLASAHDNSLLTLPTFVQTRFRYGRAPSQPGDHALVTDEARPTTRGGVGAIYGFIPTVLLLLVVASQF